MFLRAFDGFLVAGVGMSHDAARRIVPEHPFDPPRCGIGAVANNDQAGMLRIAHSDSATVMEGHPGRATGRIQQRIEQRPVGYRVRTVAHRFGFPIGTCDRAAVEVVATEGNFTRPEGTRRFFFDGFAMDVSNIDLALTFRNLHNMTPRGRADINAAVFAALKPGGLYGVVDHTRRHMQVDNVENWRRMDPVLMIKEIEAAGFEWRESGCSMCLYAGGETFGPGKRVISSTNRNFEGRQGKGSRTVLASPLTAAATAVSGTIADAREVVAD